VRSADLAREYLAAMRAITPADIGELVDAGVDPADACWHAGVTRIAHMADTGLYEPDDETGGLAFITPVRVDDDVTPESPDPEICVRRGAIVDLVAWDPRTPREWALRTGLADWLGCAGPQFLDPKPVRVWRSILAWFRAGCRGVVPLNRDPAVVYRLVMGFPGGIIPEDAMHADELRRMLERPWPLPEIILSREPALAPA